MMVRGVSEWCSFFRTPTAFGVHGRIRLSKPNAHPYVHHRLAFW